ncbi:MAG: hypothetical protein KGN76_06110 [Acidobacteriota bacterium]|nr:hypothetical protein [Acidobacteriota bacterium]
MRLPPAVTLALLLSAVPRVTSTAAPGPPAEARPVPASAVVVHHYEMNGQIRPLLFFWIGRDDVGGATITWHRGQGTAGYSLLIGSDPARAPRGINRWGYIDEEIRGSVTNLLGVMTASNEQSLEEAEASVDRHADGTHAFRVIRASIDGRQSRSAVTTLDTRQDYSFHQLGAVLDRIPPETAGDIRMVTVPDGIEPGFLSAVASLIHATVVEGPSGGARPASARYVYHGRLYDLRVARVRPVAALTVNGTTYRQLLRAEFENRNAATGSVTHFSLTYGTEGDLREIPVTISYQPRWWLRIELTLADGGAQAAAGP